MALSAENARTPKGVGEKSREVEVHDDHGDKGWIREAGQPKSEGISLIAVCAFFLAFSAVIVTTLLTRSTLHTKHMIQEMEQNLKAVETSTNTLR